MDKILHDPKDPKLWELWYIPYYGSCRILSISRIIEPLKDAFKGNPILIMKASQGESRVETRSH